MGRSNRLPWATRWIEVLGSAAVGLQKTGGWVRAQAATNADDVIEFVPLNVSYKSIDSPTVRLLTGVVGPERIGIMVAWITVIHQIGSASAAYLAGVLRITGFGLPAPALLSVDIDD
jgi:hypothetical protein